MTAAPPPLVAVSLKMYLSAAETRRYVAHVSDLLGDLDADGVAVEVAVLPSFPLLESTALALGPRGGRWGAQDVAPSDHGAQTGEVAAGVLAELGCRYVEVGHAERRRLFGETRAVIDGKLAEVTGAGMVPLYCVGETERAADPQAAARTCLADLDAALAVVGDAEIVVAYEPIWAIGAAEPADPAYVRVVCDALRTRVGETNPAARVIYGGAAGPGTFAGLAGCVDGLFLGRFAHDTEALAEVIHEVAAGSDRPEPTGLAPSSAHASAHDSARRVS